MISFGTCHYPHAAQQPCPGCEGSHPRPIGPESRIPFMGTTLLSAAEVQIGWAYVSANGWAVRAEITDPTWLDLADLPRKRRWTA